MIYHRGTPSINKQGRWLKAGVFEAMVQDWREIVPIVSGRSEQPSAVILDSRTKLQSTVESKHRAGYDGGKRKKGSKVHMAVDTLGHLLALQPTPAFEQDRRAQVAELTKQMQQITGTVEVAFVDQGYTGAQPATDTEAEGIRLEVVKLPEAKMGFVLLPRRWVVERSFGWMSRFRRLARDYERLADTLIGFHFIAFVMLMVKQFVNIGFKSAVLNHHLQLAALDRGNVHECLSSRSSRSSWFRKNSLS